MPRPLRISPVTLALAVALFGLSLARRARAEDRVVVFQAEGDGASSLAQDAGSHLPEGNVVGDASKLVTALRSAGHRGPLGKALDAPKQREKLLEALRKAAADAKIDAVVIVGVRDVAAGAKDRKKERAVRLLVVETKSSGAVREDEVRLPAARSKDDAKKVTASITLSLERLGRPGGAGEPPRSAATETPGRAPLLPDDDRAASAEPKRLADEEAPNRDTDRKADARPARTTGDPARALFVVGAGVELGTRQLEYNQPITTNLRPYRVVGAPRFAVELAIHPLVPLAPLGPSAKPTGPLAAIGIVGDFAQAFALSSAAAGGAEAETTWRRFGVGLRYRLALGDAGAFVAPMVGYAAQSFTFRGLDDKTRVEAPAVEYESVRLGLDGRVPIGPVGVMAGLGYLVTWSPDGDPDLVSGRFARMDVAGFDANLGVGTFVARGLEARFMLRYTRFFYAMNPEPGDAYVAGGALDELLVLHLGAAYVY